jgi:hypothetical protein
VLQQAGQLHVQHGVVRVARQLLPRLGRLMLQVPHRLGLGQHILFPTAAAGMNGIS